MSLDEKSADALAAAPHRRPPVPRWLLGIGPLVLIAMLLGLFTLLNAPGLNKLSEGVPPKEEVAVEDVRLTAGQIAITVRNEGPDPVSIAQVNVSDYYAVFTQTRETMAPLESTTLTIIYNWVEGDPYEVALVTSNGGKIPAVIDAAALSPERGSSFFGLMLLMGIYVGVIPVALGMLWMPFVRRSSASWVRVLLGVTVGLLAFLAIDATLEAVGLVAGSGAFGGPMVVFLGAVTAYLILEGTDAWMRRHQNSTTAHQPSALPPQRLAPQRLALLIAIGIGLHNFGEGLAIGSAYAVGSLALGASLIVGFAIHNTTEGLAIVTPLAKQPPGLGRLAILGLIAGAPAAAGALLGATVYQPALSAFLLGIGAGAVAQVAVKLLPMLKDPAGKTFTPLTGAGVVLGMGLMFATGLLVQA
ncbi:ZIP family metal transporter [Pseudarthrobacter sp. NIBRBAC000502772]|uniref:ZIP family metal transporter n=1 Tax=Pseudarthrobacter sp. NIBRBAC000502772 TaxID=2590775 RepID=UPI001131E29F|nr:ZIP family metal transporter [Pseudarthrobacter sp. NIBRBAC000502772]QDG68419.1 ZIP family metal transporter [Pseudarthrobacter sp. NIBRBAC000502772]